jgi:hypothetical protein
VKSLSEKNPINKNQRWEPIQQIYKENENTSRHNPKKKKISKDPMHGRLTAKK